MEMFIKDIGFKINKLGREFINLKMEVFTEDGLKTVNLMDKEHWNTMFMNQTILNFIKDSGKTACLMVLGRQRIITQIFTKDILLTGRGKGMAHTHLTKYIDMKGNGKTTVFMVRESCLETERYFSKGCFKMD